MRYAKSVEELIGKTPLLELSNYEKNHGLKARILAKVEGLNPSGSVKDRAALSMICLLYTSRRTSADPLYQSQVAGKTGDPSRTQHGFTGCTQLCEML